MSTTQKKRDGYHKTIKQVPDLYDSEKISASFRDSLLSSGLSNKELAQSLEVGRSVVSHLTSGTRRPKLLLVLKFANLNHKTLSTYVTGRDIPKADTYDIDEVFEHLAHIFHKTSYSCIGSSINRCYFQRTTYQSYLKADSDHFKKNFSLEQLLELCNFHQVDVETLLSESYHPVPERTRKPRS